MKLDRRSFIKNLGVGTAGALAWGVLPEVSNNYAYGAPTNSLKFIKIFFDGGPDGLGWFPYDLPEAADRRPGVQVASANMIDLGHPYVKLSSNLSTLYSNFGNKMAIFTTVAEPNSTGSHEVGRANEASGISNDGQSYMGRMVEELAKTNPTPFLGWNFSTNDQFQFAAPTYKAISTTSNLSQYSYSDYDNPNLNSTQDSNETRDRAYKMKIAALSAPPPQSPAEAKIRASQKTLDDSITAVRSANLAFGTRPVSYPGTTFGNQLKSIATLIDAGMGDCFFVRAPNGHDTHSDQINNNNNSQAGFAAGLNSLLNDMQIIGQLNNVVVLAIGEFGRQIASNSTAGTDHGWGKHAILLGGRVIGGLHGPIATPQQIATGFGMPRLLDPRVLYKDIAEMMGFNPAQIIPSTFIDQNINWHV